MIENVKGRNFTPEQFYINQEAAKGNPNNLLYAITDKDGKIRGYFWAIKEWTNELYINTLSICKELWNNGSILGKVKGFVEDLAKKEGITKILWATTNEKFFLKHGFKSSKIRLMEYEIHGRE